MERAKIKSGILALLRASQLEKHTGKKGYRFTLYDDGTLVCMSTSRYKEKFSFLIDAKATTTKTSDTQFYISNGKNQYLSLEAPSSLHRHLWMRCIEQLHRENANDVFFISFANFKRNGEFPRNPEKKHLLTPSRSIRRENAVFVFISHTWLRAHNLFSNNKPISTHPDDSFGSKYALCVEGIEKAWRQLAPGMGECYIWCDYSCLNQADNSAAAHLISTTSLDSVMMLCDIVFTPALPNPLPLP